MKLKDRQVKVTLVLDDKFCEVLVDVSVFKEKKTELLGTIMLTASEKVIQ